MPEYTPGYIAALAAALMEANTAALYQAEHGNNQLGAAIRKHPGLRAWNGHLLRLGHLPKTPFAVECNALLFDGLYVATATHEHVHIAPDIHQWVHCTADADGAIPITIAVPQRSTNEENPGVRAAAKRLGLSTTAYLANKNAGLKWCRQCKEWRPLTDYKPSTSTHDGVRPLCTRHYTPKPRVPIPHGRVTGYSRGCRCPKCRKANTLSLTRRKAERIKDPTAADRAGHGKTSTYINYGCRCEPCKAAQSETNRRNYQRRMQRQKDATQ